MEPSCYHVFMEVIARIHTEFQDKFGIPRQSGLVPSLRGRIVFAPAYRDPAAVRGLEEFSHIWLIFAFSKAENKKRSLTAAPPRLGGKVHKGIFATRSPFRPNPIGLSSVELKEIVFDKKLGPVLVVAGADLLDGTPIYDIKPYLPYTDAHPEASGGYGEAHKDDGIAVVFPEELLRRLPEELRQAAYDVLAQDPRAAYQKKPDYLYGLAFAGYDLRFTVADDVLTVRDVAVIAGKDWKKLK